MNYNNICLTVENQVANLSLNRPQVCNAFNESLIADVRQAIGELKQKNDIRILVISGNGKHFCGGGDIKWMQQVQHYDYQQNLQQMTEISYMFDDIYSLPIPTIAKVRGAAIGGGVGFVAACDIVLASEDAIFSLSEARTGLIPGCITAYLLEKIQPSYLRRYFITGEQFGADVANKMGLVTEVCTDLESKAYDMCANILQCGPNATILAKELLREVPQMDYQKFLLYGAEVVAKMRMSEEAREGFLAFIEKRKPQWRSFESQ